MPLLAGRFTFDGRQFQAEDGDTIGSALHRAGVRVLARSLKYHRPRGLSCCTGSCASCLVEVDGVPNVPACMARATEGCEVRSQNRLGSAKHDLFAVVDKVYAKGFDPHNAFTKPRALNAAFLRAVRFMSGVGRPPTEPATGAPRRHVLQVDELIVGGGLHGLRRAKQAAGQVVLVEEMPTLGGSALFDPTETEALTLASEAISWRGVEVWTGAVAFGVYGEVVGVLRGDDLWEVEAKRVMVASGRYDGLALFPNNDLPGVLSLRGASRLLHQHKVLPGSRIVGHGTALPASFMAALRALGGDVVAQGNVSDAMGSTAVTSARVDGDWVPCDAIVCNVPGTPRVELLQQAGCDLAFRGGVLTNALPGEATSNPNIFARFTGAAA